MGASIWNPTTSVPVPVPDTLPSEAITYLPAGANAVATDVRTKLRQIVSVFDYGVVGDGTTDDTQALQNCYDDHPGAEIDHGVGYTFKILSALDLYAGTSYVGKSTIKAGSSSNITTGLFNAASAQGILIKGLIFDGNGDNSGARYGIITSLCDDLEIDLCTFRDTIQAGISVDSGSVIRVTRNKLVTCGRNTGTDNHGIMLVNTDTVTKLQNVICTGNYVIDAYRKGIATYTAVGAAGCEKVLIDENIVISCGLGGIYAASTSGATAETGIVITHNICRGNYTEIEVNNTTNFIVANNDIGYGGALSFAGVAVDDVHNGTISGNTIHSAPVHAIYVHNSTTQNRNLRICDNVIRNTNTTTAGFGAGIVVSNTIKSLIASNLVDDSTAKMTHGIIEQGTSDENVFVSNQILTATSAKLTVAGTSSTIQATVAGNFGFGIEDPVARFHLAGTTAFKPVALTLVNGANQNVALPADATIVRVEGPTGAFNIGGVAGGIDGRKVVYLNYTNFTMTLNHEDAGSTAANRYLLGSGANKNVVQFGVAVTYYDATAGRWFAALA